jgi:hypothetical protein
VKRFLTLSLTVWCTLLLLHTRVTLWSGRTGEAVSTYTAEQLCGYAAADITAFCLKQSGHKVCVTFLLQLVELLFLLFCVIFPVRSLM